MNEHLWIAAVLVALGSTLLGVAIFRIVECVRSLSWPSVDATIINSSMEVESDDGLYYPAKINYRYQVHDQVFVGERIKIGGDTRHIWRWAAKLATKKYPVGERVRAYYSPQNPAISALEPGLNVALLVGTILFGIIVFANAWSQVKSAGF